MKDTDPFFGMDNPLVFPKDIADEIHTLTQELCENNVEKAPWIAEQILESDKENKNQ